MRVQHVRHRPDHDDTFELLDNTDQPILVVSGFFCHLHARGYSPNTLSAYAYDLLHFFSFLTQQQLTYQEFTPSHALLLLEYLKTLPSRKPAQRFGLVLSTTTTEGTSTTSLSPATINRTFAAVSSFYDYLMLSGEFTSRENPLQQVDDPALARVPERHRPFMGRASRQRPIRRGVKVKTVRRLPRPMGDEHLDKLLASLRLKRDKAMLLLMLHGGLRPGEILGLHIQDLEFHRNGVVIRRRAGLANGALAKGMVEHEERFVELTPQVMALLDHLVLQHTFETDHVFVVLNKSARNQRGESTYGTPLSRHALKALFRYYSQKSGIPLHAHLLRHTHATELIRAGWDASYIQQRLGHANVQTTINTYIHLDDDDLSQKWHAYQARRAQHVRPTPSTH